jgi:hypothetical protein
VVRYITSFSGRQLSFDSFHIPTYPFIYVHPFCITIFTMAAPPAYQYSRLESPNSIRLLMIEKVKLNSRTEQSSNPRCWIQHFSIDNAPPYRALSYAWEDTGTKPIFLIDQNIWVRKNLWQALWYIRPINSGVPNSNRGENVTTENTP